MISQSHTASTEFDAIVSQFAVVWTKEKRNYRAHAALLMMVVAYFSIFRFCFFCCFVLRTVAKYGEIGTLQRRRAALAANKHAAKIQRRKPLRFALGGGGNGARRASSADAVDAAGAAQVGGGEVEN
jgi:hypothetical protein